MSAHRLWMLSSSCNDIIYLLFIRCSVIHVRSLEDIIFTFTSLIQANLHDIRSRNTGVLSWCLNPGGSFLSRMKLIVHPILRPTRRDSSGKESFIIPNAVRQGRNFVFSFISTYFFCYREGQ